MRRVRVPSNVDQFSDVDQYLDDLFSPVLDGSLDELSDARSLSTSIRGGRIDFFEAPSISTDFDDLQSADKLQRVIKGGGHKNDNKENEKLDKEVADLNNTDISLDEYITGERIFLSRPILLLFQQIFFFCQEIVLEQTFFNFLLFKFFFSLKIVNKILFISFSNFQSYSSRYL